MSKKLLITLSFLGTFALGFALSSFLIKDHENTKTAKVTGIGGIFFKCKDAKAVREWYAKHLGLEVNPYGSVFEWYQGADSTQKGFTQWSPFSEKTKYFDPSTKDFMINYRVDDLELLAQQLKGEGVLITDSIQKVDYGKFLHIMDIEGNKIELWEANDREYEKMGTKMGLKTTK